MQSAHGRSALLSAALFSCVMLASPASAQDTATGQVAVPRVFFDCNSQMCDNTYYRTEIDWVAWVRDQQDANLYVIMTSQSTGVGGREFLLEFRGREAYEDYEDESRYQSLPTDTQRETLDGVALTLGIGLAKFASENGFRGVVDLQGLAVGGAAGDQAVQGVLSPEEVQDPWNLWVFRVGANGNLDKQSTRQNIRAQTGMNASRVTPTWIQRYSLNVNYRELEQELSDSTVFTDERYDWGLSARVVYALAEHWSAGFSSNIGRNTSNNQDIWGQLNPAIEYSFFPYEEATRRSLTAFYEIGPVYRHYFEATVYGKDAELRAEQALTLDFSERQPWGNASVELEGSNYLHSIHVNNVSLRGNLSFRITRGLDANVGASYSRVRDQIYLSGEGLSDEERLLRLQSEQTDYQASMSFGVSYQFGSIFNNVVNNRFD
jgi:hypothetical protein